MSWTISSPDLARARQSVRAWGARGDGVTDDTAAFAAALLAYPSVYVPAGNYVVSGLTLNGQHLYGDGGASVITQKPGTVGALLDCGETACLIESLKLVGVGGGTGIKLPASQPGTVRHCFLTGFGIRGIDVETAVNGGAGTNLQIADCWITTCGVGIYLPPNAEYVKILGCDVFGNGTGVHCFAGNVTLTGSNLNDNAVGLHLSGVGSANNAHGLVAGGTINHNSQYSMWFEQVTNGQQLAGCAIYGAGLYFQQSHVIEVRGCIVDVDDWYLEGGRQEIRDCVCPNSFNNRLHHNWNGVADVTTLDVVKPDGSYLGTGANRGALWDGNSLQPAAGNVGLKGAAGDGSAAGGVPVLYAPLANSGAWTGASLNGSNKWLSCASAAGLQVGTGSFGFAVLLSLASKSALMTALAKWATGSASDLEYALWYDHGSDRFQFVLGNGASFSQVNAASFGSPALNTLYLVACWFDVVTSQINIQINNGAIDTAGLGNPPRVGAGGFALGQDGGLGSDRWNGIIGAAGIWKGSAPPVASLWNLGNPKAFAGLTADDKLNLQSWWDNTEASGAHADSQGSNPLTNNGSVVSASGPAYTYYTQGAAWGLAAADGAPQWQRSSLRQTTVGAAGGASALPATPSGYLKARLEDGTPVVLPYYPPS